MWLFPGQKVNAADNTCDVGSAELTSSQPYTVDGTSAAADPGEGSRGEHYALFDADSKTLTINNFSTSLVNHKNTLENQYYECACIWSNADLNLVLVGNNEIHAPGSISDQHYYGVYADNELIISGPGKLSVSAGSAGELISSGICAAKITINSGTINSHGVNFGLVINTGNNAITINGGNITATADDFGIWGDNVVLNGGKLDASGDLAAVVAFTSFSLKGDKMSVKTPKGGTIELHNFDGDPIYTVMDGNNIALHAIISDHDDENNGSGDDSGNSAGGAGKACDHDYQWTVEREPTITEDGEEVYKCTKCGDISARQPLSAEGFCFLDAEGKVRNAKAGQTLKLDFKQWNSVPKAFFEELAKRRDITVVIRFTYKHKTYEMTVTPDMAIDISHDYYGPEKLILLYGAKEVKG